MGGSSVLFGNVDASAFGLSLRSTNIAKLVSRDRFHIVTPGHGALFYYWRSP
jgi:hypothetical protein